MISTNIFTLDGKILFFIFIFCMFELRFNFPVNNFKSCWDRATASWVLTTTLKSLCVLLKDTTQCY